MAKIWLLCLILLVAGLSGCTDKKTEPAIDIVNQTQANVTPASAPEPYTVYVEIHGSKFTPLEMKIVRGTTVRWTNLDSAQHVVNGDGFVSPPLNKWDMWNHTFSKTGTFEYNCSIHAWMQRGRIIVG